ncbi:MAG: hypothetical protein L3K04_01745 [Thermoplasmata archaeon]|nr:hypothetical protein [Thermoplasmata archaeon]
MESSEDSPAAHGSAPLDPDLPIAEPRSAIDGTGAPLDPPDTGLTPEAGPRRRRIPLIAVIALVLVLLLLPLLLLGLLIPSFHPLAPHSSSQSPPSPSFAQSYTQAYAAANGSAQATVGGSWGLVDAEGLATEVNAAFPGHSAAGPCSSMAPPPVPAVSLNQLSTGETAFWAFGFGDAAGDSLGVLVVNGTAQVLGESAASSHCNGPTPPARLPNPDRLMDSSTAAALMGSSWSATLGSATTSFAAFLLSDEGGGVGTQTGTAYWEVLASPCPLASVGTLGILPGDPHLLAALNATTPQVLDNWVIPGIGTCESNGTLNQALALGYPRSTNNFNGSLNYTVPIDGVNGTLVVGSFHPALVAITNRSIPAVAVLDLLDGPGHAIAVYSFALGSWTAGGTTVLTAGDSLAFESPAPLDTAALVFVANAPETGDLSMYLP